MCIRDRDNDTEAAIQRSLERITGDRTTLVIAHRLSTIRQADQIVVLAQGQVQEQGSCDTLMQAKGLFFRMMERQIT